MCPHTPDNLITLCKRCHVSSEGIHPDAGDANAKYRQGNREAYKETFAKRDARVKNGEPYWDTRCDLMLSKRAQFLTRKWLEGHPDDPYPETKQ